MSLDITIEGFPDIDLGQVEQSVRYAAMVSINKTGRWAESSLRKSAYQDVNFPSGYLDSRLNYKETSMSFLEGKVVGRDNPTSLARFASGSNFNLTISVSPGVTKKSKKMFIVNLRNGNKGLLIKLKDGEELKNVKYEKAARKFSKARKDRNLYLLYGPSVDQVMRINITDDFEQKLGDKLAENFNSNLQLRGL